MDPRGPCDDDYLFRTVVLLGLGVLCGMFPCVLVILWLVTR